MTTPFQLGLQVPLFGVGKALSGVLRPGNAAAESASDHDDSGSIARCR